MRKLVATALAGGLLAAGAWLVPASAEEVVVPGVGRLEADGDPAAQSGHILADGDDANGAYAGGWIVIGNDGTEGVDGSTNYVCADDLGSPDGDPTTGTPSCDEEIITSQLP